MGTRNDPIDGLLVPNVVALQPSSLSTFDGGAGKDGAATAQPRPGVFVAEQGNSALAIQMHHAQSWDARVKVVKAGLPGLADGVQLMLRADIDDEDDDDFRMWTPPNWIAGWNAPYWSDTLAVSGYDAVTHPATQRVVEVNNRRVDRHDPYTLAWTTASLDGGFSGDCVALVCLPNGHILCWYKTSSSSITMERSLDAGATWEVVGRGCQPSGTPTTLTKARAAYLNGDISLIARQGSSSQDLYQMASSDLGASFNLVADASTICGSSSQSALSMTVAGGRILVAYRRAADGYPTIRVLTSAYESIETATEVVLVAAAHDEVEIVADPDGLCWAFLRVTGDAAIDVYVSYDYGDTWTTLHHGVLDTDVSADATRNYKAVTSMGRVCLLHQWTAGVGDEDDSVGALWLGDWANVTTAVEAEVSLYDSTIERGMGFGRDRSGGAGSSVVWIPIELPWDNGWTHTATGGTTSLVSPGELSISTVSDIDYASIDLDDSNHLVVLLQANRDSGGADNQSIAARLRIADGTWDYEVAVMWDVNVMHVRDNNGAVEKAAWSGTNTEPGQVLVELGQGTLKVWSRTPGQFGWTLRVDGTIVNDGATPEANGAIDFGHLTSSTAASSWQIVAYHTGLGDLIEPDYTATIGSRPISNHPIPVPGMTTYTAGEPVAWLSAVGGPGLLGEEYVAAARSDYPMEAICATVEPSPDVVWRSSNKDSTIHIVWDLGANSLVGKGVALALLNHNVESCELASYNGTTWDSEVAIQPNSGMRSSLNYTLEGDVIRPADGVGVSQYIWANMLAGGYARIKCDDGADCMRPILSNTPGHWSVNTEARCEVRLGGLDGTEDATGTLRLQPPSCIALCTSPTNPRARYWRLSILNSALSYEDYREIGIAMLCRIVPFGAEQTWGSQQSLDGNVSQRRSRSGTTRVQEEGPPMPRWRLNFTEPECHDHLRGSDDIDYRGWDGSDPIIAMEDTAFLLQGVFKETKSGEYPVVAVSQLQANATITDPTLWCYGRMLGPIVTTHEIGNWGVNEHLRTDPVEIDPLV